MERANYSSVSMSGPQIIPARLRSVLIIQNGDTAGHYGLGKSATGDADVPLAAHERVVFEVVPTSAVVVNTLGDFTVIQNGTTRPQIWEEFSSAFSSAFK